MLCSYVALEPREREPSLPKKAWLPFATYDFFLGPFSLPPDILLATSAG